MEQGYDVKVSEVHGMSQRGGSVVTYVRYGIRCVPRSSTRERRTFIVSFEVLERRRLADLTSKPTADRHQHPADRPHAGHHRGGSISGKPGGEDEGRRGQGGRLDCLKLAEEAGSSKAVNLVLLGRLSRYFDFPEEAWQKAIDACVPEKFLELNRRAFALGRG